MRGKISFDIKYLRVTSAKWAFSVPHTLRFVSILCAQSAEKIKLRKRERWVSWTCRAQNVDSPTEYVIKFFRGKPERKQVKKRSQTIQSLVWVEVLILKMFRMSWILTYQLMKVNMYTGKFKVILFVLRLLNRSNAVIYNFSSHLMGEFELTNYFSLSRVHRVIKI